MHKVKSYLIGDRLDSILCGLSQLLLRASGTAHHLLGVVHELLGCLEDVDSEQGEEGEGEERCEGGKQAQNRQKVPISVQNVQ